MRTICCANLFQPVIEQQAPQLLPILERLMSGDSSQPSAIISMQELFARRGIFSETISSGFWVRAKASPRWRYRDGLRK